MRFLDEEDRIIDFIPSFFLSCQEVPRKLVSLNSLDNHEDLKYIRFEINSESTNHEVFYGLINNEGKIIILLSYYCSGNDAFFDWGKDWEYIYISGSDVILFGNTIYALDGRELFPGNEPKKNALEVISALSDGRFILCDKREWKYFFLEKDLSMTPFDDSFYSSSQSHGLCWRPNKFHECGENYIVAERQWSGITESVATDKNGCVIIERQEGEIFFDHKRDCFIVKGISGAHNVVKDLSGRTLFNFTRSSFYCNDNYVDLSPILDNNGLMKVSKFYRIEAGVRLKESYGIANEKLQIVFPIICDCIRQFVYPLNTYYYICVNGKVGVYSALNNQMTIPILYDDVKVIGEKFFCVITGKYEETHNEGQTVIKGGKQEFVSFEGESLLHSKIFESLSIYYNEHIVVKVRDGKSGVVDTSLIEIIPFDYDCIIPKPRWREPMCYLVNKKVDIIDSTDDAEDATAGIKWGAFLDCSQVVECKYDSIEIIYHSYGPLRFFRVELRGKYGLIDPTGKIVVPINFCGVFTERSESVVRVLKEDADTKKTWAFYDINKMVIVSPDLDFDEVDDFFYGLAIVKKRGKYGFLNDQYEIAINCEYDEVYNFTHQGTAKVVLGNDYIVIDKDGNHIGTWSPVPQSSNSKFDGGYSGYSQADLRDMYRGAFDDDPDAQWNID